MPCVLRCWLGLSYVGTGGGEPLGTASKEGCGNIFAAPVEIFFDTAMSAA